MSNSLNNLPIFGPFIKAIKKIIRPSDSFTTSKKYWEERYAKGGDSGSGSYDKLAEFKGEVINEFIQKHNIQSVIELGSGDGNQQAYFEIPEYIGFDISSTAVLICNEKYKNDPDKQFYELGKLGDRKAQATMSLDVLYHLIEYEIYDDYLHRLFDAAENFVIIYANNSEDDGSYAPHVKPREFTKWVQKNKPDFHLLEHIPNRYPYIPGNNKTSFAEFFIYKKN